MNDLLDNLDKDCTGLSLETKQNRTEDIDGNSWRGKGGGKRIDGYSSGIIPKIERKTWIFFLGKPIG